jgi:hypothetical protein
VIFGVLFVPLKQFLDYLELFLALKINSKKKKKLSSWNGPSPKARPAPARPRPRWTSRRPAEAHLGQRPLHLWPAAMAAAGALGVRARLHGEPRPYKATA